jgi:TonB family protein
MGDSAPIDLRRRYARPDEFEAPNSVLESNAFKQRLGGELKSERTSPVPPSRQLPAEASKPVPREPAPTGSQARLSVKVPPSRELHAGEVSNPIRRNSTHPGNSEAHLSVNVEHPRSALPLSREVRGGESHLRRNPVPVKSEARLSVNLHQHARAAVPVSRELRLGGESQPRRSLAPVRSDARLSVDSQQYRRSPAPLAAREAIPRRRTSARFELLPEPEPRWNQIGVSAVAQLAFLGLLLLSPMIFPQQMETALRFDVVDLMQPVTLPPATPPPPPPKIKPKLQPREPKPVVPKPKPVEVEPPQLNPKQPHVFLILKPQLPKVHNVEAKPVDLKPIFAQAEIVLTSNQPKRPKEEIKAPNLRPMRPKEEINAPSLGLGSLPATVAAAANKVQTGGFGDPHGMHGPANPSKAANINAAGSPNLPGGPGYGNGTGGAQGARGTLASTEGPKSNGAGTGGAATGGATTGVAILSKPNPAYSTEARTKKLEGDVVLEVVFLSSGQVQVIRVVSGLGHGLDEAAIQAARMIRFRPAQRDGQPVDFHAHVRIEFRLAN